MEEYFRAKQLLFTWYFRKARKKNDFAIIIIDDSKG